MRVSILFASLALSLGGSAQAASVRLPVTFAGLPVGAMDYSVDIKGTGYVVNGEGTSSGVGRLASSASSTFRSRGLLGEKGPLPASHSVSYRDGEKEGSASIKFREGRVSATTETPPPKKRKDRVPVTDAMLRGAVDPVSAMLVPAPPKADIAAVCDRTIKVSDARNVFSIALAPLRSGRLDDGTRTHTCTVRYTPLGGHRASSKSVKRIAKNDSMRMTFAALTPDAAGPSVWGVVGFRFKSRFGMVRGLARGVDPS